MHNHRPILLVEDDLVDTMTVKRALSVIDVENQLVHTVDGEQALEYLRGESNTKPCVVLLDLNLPRMNGIEFLKVTKTDGVLKQIPVIVLTTSKKEQDIVETFKLGVAGYMVKPVGYAKFVELIRTIVSYLSLSELPDVK